MDYQTIYMNDSNVLLQTRIKQYQTPILPSDEPLATRSTPLHIPHLGTSPTLTIPHLPIKRMANNLHARATHHYSIVDDLAQSHATMYAP